ncbi:MAG: recombinase RecT [Ruthenibacterium sp.]
MAMNNSLQKQTPRFSVAIQGDGYKNLINSTLGDPQRAKRFVAAVSSAVATNPDLQTCDAGTILSSALLGESLNLSPSPQLGQYYLVPYNDNKNGRKVAQFQLGYKGYLQLATRSGNYRKLHVETIKSGELVRYNPLEEEIEVHAMENEIERENAETIGYYAMFEYLNGFRKILYWSREKMESHALKYSKGYAAHKGYTFWEKDFDSMAKKTMLRQLISKWGVMSTEMQSALEGDMGVIHEDKSVEYVDNDTERFTPPQAQDNPPVDATDEPDPFQ